MRHFAFGPRQGRAVRVRVRNAALAWLLAGAALAAAGASAKAQAAAPPASAAGAGAFASEQNSEADTLGARAQELLRWGHARAVIELLTPVLAADSAGARPQWLELLGRADVRAGDLEGGLATFTRLLDRAPEWALDPRRVADDESAVFARARREWLEAHPGYRPVLHAAPVRATPFYRQRRFQLAGGATVAVVVALLRHQGTVQANTPLPALPGHP